MCSTTLREKRFLTLSQRFSVCPWPLVRSPGTSEQSLTLLSVPAPQASHSLLKSLPSLFSPAAERGRCPVCHPRWHGRGAGTGARPEPGPRCPCPLEAPRPRQPSAGPAPPPAPGPLLAAPPGRPAAAPPLPPSPAAAPGVPSSRAEPIPGVLGVPEPPLTHRRLPGARSTTGRDVTARGGAPRPRPPRRVRVRERRRFRGAAGGGGSDPRRAVSAAAALGPSLSRSPSPSLCSTQSPARVPPCSLRGPVGAVVSPRRDLPARFPPPVPS